MCAFFSQLIDRSPTNSVALSSVFLRSMWTVLEWEKIVIYEKATEYDVACLEGLSCLTNLMLGFLQIRCGFLYLLMQLIPLRNSFTLECSWTCLVVYNTFNQKREDAEVCKDRSVSHLRRQRTNSSVVQFPNPRKRHPTSTYRRWNTGWR